MSSKNKPVNRRSRTVAHHLENLEARELFATDIALPSPPVVALPLDVNHPPQVLAVGVSDNANHIWTNPENPLDVDANGRVDAAVFEMLMDELNASGICELQANSLGRPYL